jgi:hypothetical protein
MLRAFQGHEWFYMELCVILEFVGIRNALCADLQYLSLWKFLFLGIIFSPL